MTLVETIVLAVVQGLTEFLPISSSAHLLLPSQILGWSDQGLAFDVAVHVGTLIAVVLYFWSEVRSMSVAWGRSVVYRRLDRDGKLAWCIALATIPACLAGGLLGGFIEAYLRSAWVIAGTTIVFGLLLWRADRKALQEKDEYQTGWRDALLIGLAQALALIPGTSRSGITMTAGLMLGLTRQGAARYSFLMSIPVILLAGGYASFKLVQSNEQVHWGQMGMGMAFSFIAALACIHYFLKLLARIGMLPFVVYRLVLGIGLLVFLM